MADICTLCKMTGKRRDAKRTNEYCEICFEPFCPDHGVVSDGHAFCDTCAKDRLRTENTRGNSNERKEKP